MAGKTISKLELQGIDNSTGRSARKPHSGIAGVLPVSPLFRPRSEKQNDLLALQPRFCRF
jgi:hypothetical protein